VVVVVFPGGYYYLPWKNGDMSEAAARGREKQRQQGYPGLVEGRATNVANGHPGLVKGRATNVAKGHPNLVAGNETNKKNGYRELIEVGVMEVCANAPVIHVTCPRGCDYENSPLVSTIYLEKGNFKYDEHNVVMEKCGRQVNGKRCDRVLTLAELTKKENPNLDLGSVSRKILNNRVKKGLDCYGKESRKDDLR
jgi:hypothetical protein